MASFDPGVIVLLALAVGLYARGERVLRRRGYRVPFWQQVAWYAGLALLAVALLGPLDPLADDLLSAHMGQHLLIADLAAPLLLVGIRTPMHVFLLPRLLLVRLARMRRLRGAFRFLRSPLVALPVYAVALYGWHFAFAFEAALRDPLVHALQHASFVLASVLVWWAPVEPKLRRARGELWKIGHLIGARLVGMFLGMALLATRTPVYEGFYGERARAHGLSPLADQSIGGGLMLGLDVVIMLFALAFFFWRAAQDHDRAERAAAATG